ncbi:hypothetical protein [Paraburkholderia sp. GAS42]|jgi:CO/xanthine dehydrogenase FAD-binding subunit|uniref:hypothetical protein n=1 Tax=Paraburkholderia sp. GAS42 TaxID=3035135 RepID=UPI003D213299
MARLVWIPPANVVVDIRLDSVLRRAAQILDNKTEGVADAAFNARAAEALLDTAFEGRPEQIREIAAAAVAGVAALEDSFADSAYRLQLAKVMVQRALVDALNDAPSNG